MRKFYTLLLSMFSLAAWSQTTTLTGVIRDAKGNGIPFANIVVVDTYDGGSADADGKFSFETTEAGERTVQVTAVGFKSAEIVATLNGKTIELSFVLKDVVNELEAVTISAGSFTAGEEKRRTILKPLDIATTAGATADIAGALNTLPGTTKVGESGRLFVRGGDDSEARTFIDGMVVLNAYSPAAPNTPSRGRFLPWMFKGTSFSTGGYSAEYGQALSSALVLNSKDKVETTQTDIGIMSVGTDVAHTQAWERGSATAKVQYTNLRPYTHFISQRVDWIEAPASLEASTAARHSIGKNGVIKAFGNANHSDFSLYNHDIADDTKRTRFELTNNYGYGNLAYSNVVSSHWNVRGGLSYTLNQSNATLNNSPLRESETGWHAKGVAEHSISDRVEMRFGAELLARSYVAASRDDQTMNTMTQRFKENISVFFVETEAYASNRFVARGGGRLEYNSLNGKVLVDPRISIAYKPGRQGQVAFAYGVFHQSPKNIYVRVNNKLASEQAEHFILNYQVINDRRTFRVETYYKRYGNLTRFADASGYVLNNEGYGYARGAEVFWRDNKSFRGVDYWLSYSFLDTKRTYLNFPSMATPTFASRHNFSVVYKHFITKLKSQVGMTYSYGSGRPYNDPNKVGFNAQATRAYQDLSINISYLPTTSVIVYLSCSNVLGYNNVFGYEYASTPDENGRYAQRAIRQPAPRFMFVGVFITLSKNKSVNQLPNL